MTKPDETTSDHVTYEPDARLTAAIAAFRYTVNDEQFKTDELIAYLQDTIIEKDMAYRHLEGAIASSRRIGAAVGIVMSVLKVTEDDAFGVLARISQRQNRKLRLVADDVVLTGTF